MAKRRRRSVQKRKKKTSKEDIRTKRISLLLLGIALLGVGYFFYNKNRVESNTFESDKYFVKGIDVSHHNPILNWDEVENQNITFAYLKATEGIAHQDRNYPYNYELAKETNVKIGSYHFYSFGLSGKEQAKHFIKTASCKSGDLIPAIDVEHSKANPHSTDSVYVTSLKRELKVLEKELYEYYGVRPIIYTNKECYKLYVKELFPNNLIWLCDLHNEPSEDIQNWRIWQFTHEGKIKGIPEDIDFNYYRYSFQEFKELLLP